MSGDIYASLSGASAALYQMDVLSQNVANMNTPAYKELRVTFSLEGSGDGSLGQAYAMPTEAIPDFRNGAIQVDNDPLHFALKGEGFFSVDTGQDSLLTRVGAFMRDQDGFLVTADGHRVLGEGGPVEIPPDESFRVLEDGTIMGDQSGELGRLSLLQAEEVKPLGAGLWKAVGPTRPAVATVVQGALERSNVDPLRAMVELVEASRYFEAYQKAMQASDELDDQLNDLGGA